MPTYVKATLALAAIAILGVVVVYQLREARLRSWDILAAAEAQGGTVEALEDARSQAHDGPAGPWIDYQLAIKLFDRGDDGDFDRAEQIARESVRDNPDHATSRWMGELLDALATYDTGS